MTMITASSTHARPRASVLTMLTRWRALRHQRQVLSQLDTRTLKDIGVTQSEAETEARRVFWDAPESWRF